LSPPLNFTLSEHLFIVEKIPSKNTKFGAENPTFQEIYELSAQLSVDATFAPYFLNLRRGSEIANVTLLPYFVDRSLFVQH